MLPVLPFVFRLISPIVVATALDHLQKVGKLDTTQFKIDVDQKVRAIVPGTMLDDDAVRFVNRQVDTLQIALRDTAEEQKVLALVVGGNLVAAGEEILRYAFPTLTAA